MIKNTTIKRALIGTCLITASTANLAFADTFSCAAFPNGDFDKITVLDGQVQDKGFLETLRFENGVASLKCDNKKLYLISDNAKIEQAFRYDNGPDYFSEGLVRIIGDETGLIGYANEELDVVIQPQFTNATPFKNAQALVSVKNENNEILWGVITPDGLSKFGISHNSREAAVEQQTQAKVSETKHLRSIQLP